VATINNHVYPRKTMEDAISSYMENDLRLGMLMGPEDISYQIDMSKVSHKVDRVFIDDDGIVCAEITFLEDSACGKSAYAQRDSLSITPIMAAMVPEEKDGKHIITDVSILSFKLFLSPK